MGSKEMKTGSIYSASDKALFDALTQHTVTQSALRQLFLKRGIIVSHDTHRDVLAKYFSRLVHDYEDFQTLARMFGSTNRRERTASFRVLSTASLSNFESAAAAVVEQISENGDSATVNRMEDGSIKIIVRYKKFHFEKNEFKQVVSKEAVISIEQDKGAIVIRGPQNGDVDDWCRSIISNVESQLPDAIQIDEISLENYNDPKVRSSFFDQLIKGISGYKKHDVTDVYVFHPKGQVEKDGDGDGDGDDVGGGGATGAIAVGSLGVHISRASLKGEGVLDSDEFVALMHRGFYISKIVWQAKNNTVDSDIYEFEAQFSEPETCTKFSYLPRGFYKYTGNQEYSKSRAQFTNEEDRELNIKIEIAARAVLLDIEKSTQLVTDNAQVKS
ncbi:MAG: hypothetical protein ABIG35_04515 [Pseudomonadota bacterium]